MSGTAPKDKGGKFWKKLGLGKKSSAEGTLSRSGEPPPTTSVNASIISRASSTDKLADIGANIRPEASESTKRNNRRSMISTYSHRRAASEIDSNVMRSHSTINFGKSHMAPPNQQSRLTTQTMNSTNLNAEKANMIPLTSAKLMTESKDALKQTAVSTEIKVKLNQQSNSETDTSSDAPMKENNQTEWEIPQKSLSKTTVLDQSMLGEAKSNNQSLIDSTTSTNIPSRSNLPKLNSLRTSSPSIARTSSASSLRQQASRLRQPTRSVKSRNSCDTLKEPTINVPKAYTIVNMPVNTNIDELQKAESTGDQSTRDLYYSLDDDQSVNDRETELLSQLEREKAVNRVLQGQKAAINKDLEYLSQMVDELSIENEQLKEQFEDQKDMDLLLEKVKSANAIARDAGLEKESLRRELEVQSLQVESRYTQYEDQLSEKSNEVRRLKAQLDQSKEQIKVLKSTMEQLIRVNVVNNKEEEFTQSQSPERLTPATSPDIQTAKIPQIPSRISQRQSMGSVDSEERITSPRSATFDLRDDTDTSHKHKSPSPTAKRASLMSNYSKRDSMLFYDDGDDDLDEQMRLLVEQKERLQSDYSKIPIVGGGPTSRKRREDLEEQLDNIDSQLKNSPANREYLGSLHRWTLTDQAFDGDRFATMIVTLLDTECLRTEDAVEVVTTDESIVATLTKLGFSAKVDNILTLPLSQQQEYVKVKREERQAWHQRQQQKLDTDLDQALSSSKPLILSEQERYQMVNEFAQLHRDTLVGFVRQLAAFLSFQEHEHNVAAWDMPRARIVMMEQIHLLVEVLGFQLVDEPSQASSTVVQIEEPERTLRFEINPHMSDNEIHRIVSVLKPTHLQSAAAEEFSFTTSKRIDGAVIHDRSCLAWLRNIIASLFDALPHLFR
ncbi:hypothetical protein INT43_004807 [Umbelopsis isabellina]|uniref:Uncharacterized protein n=1 Tax=Mortierella isabellina TaxID=91625 RepID=A0A8H7U6X1_MORIS|nr:hypothetical protein INT43_004807 [Umbelopsis isabellina]